MKKITYIAIDLHSKHSVMGYMDHQGTYLGHQRFGTTASNLVQGVVGIPASANTLPSNKGKWPSGRRVCWPPMWRGSSCAIPGRIT